MTDIAAEALADQRSRYDERLDQEAQLRNLREGFGADPDDDSFDAIWAPDPELDAYLTRRASHARAVAATRGERSTTTAIPHPHLSAMHAAYRHRQLARRRRNRR